MKIRHLPILAIGLGALLAGCSSNSPAPTAAPTTTAAAPVTSTSTTSAATTTAPATTTTAPGTPTSVNAAGGRCAVVALTDGQTVLTDAEVAVGAICNPSGGNGWGISGTTCKNGVKLYTASSEWWWQAGQPVHKGRPDNATVNACAA